MNIDEVRRKLTEKMTEMLAAGKIEEDFLDETVHSMKDMEASSINNEGIEAQLDYIDDRDEFTTLLDDLEKIDKA